jgi:hypothetical protein
MDQRIIIGRRHWEAESNITIILDNMQLANHEKKVGQRDTNGWENSVGDSLFAETELTTDTAAIESWRNFPAILGGWGSRRRRPWWINFLTLPPSLKEAGDSNPVQKLQTRKPNQSSSKMILDWQIRCGMLEIPIGMYICCNLAFPDMAQWRWHRSKTCVKLNEQTNNKLVYIYACKDCCYLRKMLIEVKPSITLQLKQIEQVTEYSSTFSIDGVKF